MDEQLKFVADEGVEKEIVVALRKSYDVFYVVENLRSASDDFILEKAEKERRILITLDKDFGELVFRMHQLHSGVILCRLQSLPIEEAVKKIETEIAKYGAELYSAFTVITPRNTRIRKQQL